MISYFTMMQPWMAFFSCSLLSHGTHPACIRFHCMGAVGMTQEWVLNDNITSAQTVVQMMFRSMPENLRSILF